MSTITILIADDHEVIHIGVCDIMKSNPAYQVIGHACNGVEAIELAKSLNPDVIFLDITMPVLNGIEAAKEIRRVCPSVKLIALSQHEETAYVRQFLKNGGDGYLLKNSGREDFNNAIDTVLKNRHYLSYELTEQMINTSIAKEDIQKQEEQVHLTRREIEIIREIAEGKSTPEIADRLYISHRTVETHRRNIMQKLKVNSVVALLKYASLHKLIEF